MVMCAYTSRALPSDGDRSSPSAQQQQQQRRRRRADGVVPLSIVALALLFASGVVAQQPPAADSAAADCECSCCKEDACPLSMTAHLLSAGGDPSQCTPSLCSSQFYQCADPGSHSAVDGSLTLARYFDCTCECCVDAESCGAGVTHVLRAFAGHEEQCTESLCLSSFFQCKDPDSNPGSLIKPPTYSGALSPAEGTCNCDCCSGSACNFPQAEPLSFFAQAATECSSQACRDTFSECSPSSADEVHAELFDCTCSCCTESTCPSYSHSVFLAGSAALCTEEHCASLFYQCPDVGSHQGGHILALYNELPFGAATSGGAPSPAVGAAAPQPVSPPDFSLVSSGTVSSTDDIDCSCTCCSDPSGCTSGELKTQSIHVGSPGQCTASACTLALPELCPATNSDQILASFLDCECSCCRGEAPMCPLSMTKHLLSAGSSSLCTPSLCSSHFYQCADPGSHHSAMEGEVAQTHADFFDCTCACCTDADSCEDDMYHFLRTYAGHPNQCNERLCMSSFYQCKDPISHVGSHIRPPTYSGPVTASDLDTCGCDCCAGEQCTQDGELSFYAKTPEDCSAAVCRESFEECDSNTDEGIQVYATFYDCTCSCCLGDDCPTYTSNVFASGSADSCSAEQCAVMFDACPDPAAEGHIISVYRGVVTPPGDSSPLSTAAVVGICVVALLSLAGLLIGLGVYIYQRQRGYKWMAFETDSAKLTQNDGNKAKQQAGLETSAGEPENGEAKASDVQLSMSFADE